MSIPLLRSILSWFIWRVRERDRENVQFFSFKFKLIYMFLHINTGSLNSYIFLTQLLPFHCQGMELSSSVLLKKEQIWAACEALSWFKIPVKRATHCYLVEFPLTIDSFNPFIVFYSHLLHSAQYQVTRCCWDDKMVDQCLKTMQH